MILLVFLVALCAIPAQAQILINELMIRPAPAGDTALRHQWVELYNKGANAVSLGGWRLTAQDSIGGSRSIELPRTSLGAGSYLVVHFSTGEDRLEPDGGVSHFYTQTGASGRFLPFYSGDLALYSPEGVADFFAWVSIGQSYVPGEAHRAAAAASQWAERSALNVDAIAEGVREVARFMKAGTSVGRDKDSRDTGSPFDFDALGGRDAGFATPGAANIIELERFARQAPLQAAGKDPRKKAAAPAKWTVLLYLNGDNSLGNAMTQTLDSIASSGGSNSDVQFVFLVDRLRQAYRGRLLSGKFSDGLQIIEPPPGESVAVGNVNMSAGATLREFLDWGVTNYPAERYMLVIAGHGDGWKGIGPDNSNQSIIETPTGVRTRQDWLYMNELAAGLSGRYMDIIWFNSCYMAGLEVAYQIGSSGRYMIATEDLGVMETDWKKYVQFLNEDPSMPTLTLAKAINQIGYDLLLGHRDETYSQAPIKLGEKSEYDILVKSVIDLQQITPLAAAVSRWARDLTTAVPLHQLRGNPSDNVQVRIQVNAKAATRFKDSNFVDLFDLATLIGADRQIPECAKRAIPEILDLIENKVVVSRLNGQVYPQARGIHIHFPFARAYSADYVSATGTPGSNERYEFPIDVRQTDAASRVVDYYRNTNLLPLKARDREGTEPIDLAAPAEAPAPGAPDFDFPRDNSWPIFLDAYYHPVAEAWITQAVIGTTPLQPVTVGGGSCENGYDYVKGPIGTQVTLSAAGSSDADMESGGTAPYFFDWDLDITKDCSKPPCWQPTTVPNGSDAATGATDNVDQDRFPGNTTWDDQDAAGETTIFRCTTAGTFQLRLVAWDDHHTFDFLNTLPTAEYVFPQTGHHYAVVECTDWAGTGVPPPETGGVAPTPVTSGGYPFMQTGGDQVISDHALQRPATETRSGQGGARAATFTNSRNFEPNYPITVSGVNLTQLEANGVRIPDGGRATVLTDAVGVLRTRFLTGNAATGALRLEPAGLPAVQLPFAFPARLAPAPDSITVIPPQSGPLTVGQDYNLIVEARRGGELLRDAVVTAFTADSNVEFRNGTLFRRNTANQTRSGTNGRATAAFRPTANGPATIEINSGPLYRTYTYTATGGPSVAPSSIDVISVPVSSVVDQPAEIRLRVRAGTDPVANSSIEVSLSGGPATTIVTATNGEAVYRFTPTSPLPATITAAVAPANLRILITVPVFPSAP